LLFFGNTIVRFLDLVDKNTLLYQKMTTKTEDVRKG
ncbi:conjugal transfer protein, partial [Streptococcus suis]